MRISDWSSDVCSSDLLLMTVGIARDPRRTVQRPEQCVAPPGIAIRHIRPHREHFLHPALPDRGSGADDLGGPGVDRKAVPRLSHAGAVYLSGGQRLACEWRRDDDDIDVLFRVYPACRKPIAKHVVVAGKTVDHGKPKPCIGKFRSDEHTSELQSQ